MQIGIPLFEGFTALDAIGPYEILCRLPGATVTFLGFEQGAVRTEEGQLALLAEARLDQVSEPEVVCIPGGPGVHSLLDDERILSWIRRAHERSRWTTSVCSGSLLLGAAGILKGLEATCHWLELDQLERFDARPVERRVVEQGRIMTAAGVSSGIDMALILAARIAGDEVAKAIQLSIEYDPRPPFQSGSTRSAAPETVELVRSIANERSRARSMGGAKT